jgi:NADH-quinone oxidoreductase subunit L
MFGPLVILAILGVIAGFPFVAGQLSPALPEHAGEFHVNFLFWISLGALILGAGSGFVLYAGKEKDPLSIPLLQNRFYIDGFYDNFLVRYFQDAFAAIIAFFDEFIINGLIVGGLSRTAESTGNLFRKVQSGSLQGYAFAFGLGVILVIYFTVFPR